MKTDIIWSNVLNNIKNEVNSLTFDTWFKETKLYSLKNNNAYIIVPMPLHKRLLKVSYNELIVEKLHEETDTYYELIYLLNEEIEDDMKTNNNYEHTDLSTNDNNNEFSYESNLNEKYTFENFVVGNSNKFAQAASLSVAENPGKMYNPLFIYGESGLGKTHLMHAIGNYIIKNSNKRVLYVTSDQFIQDFININKKDDTTGNNINYIDYFKNKYRNIDILMIDDIQFLGRASQTQQEFFQTFNSLYNDSKQIVISSDRSPQDLKLLEMRLRTRFCWGLTVNIFPPDFNLRVEILKKKIIGESIVNVIDDDVVEYIASNIGPDVRQLEGAITRVIAYSTIMGAAKIDVNFAIEALKDFISKGMNGNSDSARVMRIVSEHFQISVEDIKSKKRNANIAFPRQIAMYLCRNVLDESLKKIGSDFGGKDHTTVMHSVSKIEKAINENLELKNTIEKLKKDIINV